MAASEPVTELNLLVGSIFTTRPEEDREQFENEQEAISELQDLLREDGIEVDLLSRPGVEIWEGGIERFGDLYHLRLLAAYLEHGKDIAKLRTARDVLENEPDPLLVAIWEGDQTTRFPHLLNHQAEGGYYLPADFPEPIWLDSDLAEMEDLDEEGESVICFGSSVALQRELAEIQDMLGKAGVDDHSRPGRCLTMLRAAADQSVANNLPIIVW